MKQEYKSSLGLVFKILIILALPILLFSYVDSQPTPIVKDEDDKGTRSVAIVNEDLGHANGTEEFVLGQDIRAILQDQKDYSWVVVNRSAAEQGFSKQEYDAILYVPSNFSKNVMTFKDESPSKASINYVIEPNLEAKERQRIHREMANAKSAINHEMSTIYWGYVSEEIDNIRKQFDKILEKEISFQEAMYSFYTPSSETLASEIELHKNKLEGILEQTSRIDETSKDNVNNLSEAGDSISQFTEALDVYKESQFNQEQLLGEFQTENKQSIQDGVESYNKALESSMEKIEEQYTEQSVIVLNQKDILQERFGTMQGKLQDSQMILDDWRVYQEGRSINQEKEFKEMAIEIVEKYTGKTPTDELENASTAFDISLGTFKEGPISEADPDPVPEPVDPDIDEEEIFEELEDIPTEPEEEVIKESESHSDTVNNNWKEYGKASKDNYSTILTKVVSANKLLVQNIEEKQDKILESNVLSKVEKDKLREAFEGLGDIENKTTESLVAYSESLSVYQTVINQQITIDKKLVAEIMEEDKQQDKIKSLFKVNNEHSNKLEAKLGIETNKDEDNFTELVKKAEDNLNSSNENIEETISGNRRIVNEMNESANLVASQMSELNAEMFEWEESPSVEDLDGQMVFQFHQNTTSSLEGLSGLVTSLGENQSDITGNAEELQETVGSVQEESDKLNDRWSSNVANTEQVKGDVYDVLGNTIVDGQSNPYVYDYLSNPVTVQGQTDGKVLSETEDRMPPVILFIIILLSGLLIGFLTQYYSSNSYLVQGGLFILLTTAVGLIISIYGLNIYPLDDSQAIMWSAFTILLLMAGANIVRAGLFVGPFVGWLASILMIMFFITPLLNIIVPEFNFVNPVSNVYMGLLYGSSSTSYALTMIGMLIIVLIMSALIYTLQIMRSKVKAEEVNEEAA